jgi:hypothetical protein
MLKLQILCGSAFFKSSPPAREDFLGQGMSELREIRRAQRNAGRFGSNSRKLECDVRKVSHEIVVPHRQTIGAGRFIDDRGPGRWASMTGLQTRPGEGRTLSCSGGTSLCVAPDRDPFQRCSLGLRSCSIHDRAVSPARTRRRSKMRCDPFPASSILAQSR